MEVDPMESTEEIKARLAKMLLDTREKRGMKLGEVAGLVGWRHYQTLHSIENGTRDVKASELSKLARIYGKRMEYFLFGAQELDNMRVLWRAKGNNKRARIFEDRFKDYLHAYIRFERINDDVRKFPSQQLQQGDVDWKWVGRQANICAKSFGPRPAKTFEKVLERVFGVKIFYFHLGEAGSAASTIIDGHAGLLVNGRDVPWRRNFDLAHEFFHLLTWDAFPEMGTHCSFPGKTPVVEKYADAFAAALLMPTEEVMGEFNARVKDNRIAWLDCIGLAIEFGVSTHALLLRLTHLRLLEEGQASKLYANKGLRELDRKTRKGLWHTRPELPERFIYLGFRAMMNGYLSRAKLAQYLCVHLSSLSEFLEKHHLSEEENHSIEIATT
jgi:Zn-dependent peptidase ImmA (M78 family)/transcriptional regulator with XRE-family HTH domain